MLTICYKFFLLFSNFPLCFTMVFCNSLSKSLIFATHDGYEIYGERGFNSHVRRVDHEIKISNSNDPKLEKKNI